MTVGTYKVLIARQTGPAPTTNFRGMYFNEMPMTTFAEWVTAGSSRVNSTFATLQGAWTFYDVSLYGFGNLGDNGSPDAVTFQELSDSGGWFDVSSYAKSFNTARGRDDVGQQVNAGSATITFNNPNSLGYLTGATAQESYYSRTTRIHPGLFGPRNPYTGLYNIFTSNQSIRIHSVSVYTYASISAYAYKDTTYSTGSLYILGSSSYASAVSAIPLFCGQITNIYQNPHPDYQETVASLTDAFGFLNNVKVTPTITAGQYTGTHINAILDAAGWPARARNIDTGSFQMTPTINNASALSACQTLATDNEGGMFIIDGNGFARFESYGYRDDPTNIAYRITFYPEMIRYVTLNRNIADIVNYVTITYATGVATAESTTSQTKKGLRRVDISAPALINAADAQARANKIIAQRAATGVQNLEQDRVVIEFQSNQNRDRIGIDAVVTSPLLDPVYSYTGSLASQFDLYNIHRTLDVSRGFAISDRMSLWVKTMMVVESISHEVTDGGTSHIVRYQMSRNFVASFVGAR